MAKVTITVTDSLYQEIERLAVDSGMLRGPMLSQALVMGLRALRPPDLKVEAAVVQEIAKLVEQTVATRLRPMK